MEYIVFFAVIGGLLLIMFAKGTWDNYKLQQRFIKHLYYDY